MLIAYNNTSLIDFFNTLANNFFKIKEYIQYVYLHYLAVLFISLSKNIFPYESCKIFRTVWRLTDELFAC